MRFTQTLDAFYITTLYAPNSTLVVNSPVPYLPGDQVTVVGGNLSGTVVPSELLANGSLQLNISEGVRNADEYAWVFKIPYVSNGTASAGGNGSSSSGNGSDSGSGAGTTNSSSGSSSGSTSGSGAQQRPGTWLLSVVFGLAVPGFVLLLL